MTRLVLRVAGNPGEEPGQEEIFLSLEDPPWNIDNPEQLRPFSCERDELLERFNEDPPSGDNVREVGETLLSRLGQHPAIRDAVRNALQIPHNERCPLYVRLVGSETAAEYPWETLYDPRNGFLALEGRWPIARIAAQVPRESSLRAYTPPIKLMAVMSAAGVSAREEWNALHRVLVDAAARIDIKVSIWVGERDLARDIEAQLQNLEVPCAMQMLTTTEALLSAVRRLDPHILHFFCHGSGGDQPRMQLATRRDHVRGHGSSIVLEAQQLRHLAPGSWMVVLNCCKGASDADGVRSLAYVLIASGYPAAVGMREPVSTATAAVFARGFYSSLFDELTERLVPGEEVELELAASLVAPRRELRDRFPQATPMEAAARHREWTLPVLYMRPDPLRIKRASSDPVHSPVARSDTTNYVNTLIRYRLEAPPDTPPDVLERVDVEIRRALGQLQKAA